MKLKILFVIPKLGCGGAEILLGAICEELYHRGHLIKLICLHEHHYTMKNFPNRDFILQVLKPVIIKYNINLSIRDRRIDNYEYEKIVKEFKPDVIHSHLFEAEIVSRSYLTKDSVYFTHCHDEVKQFEKLKASTVFSKAKLVNYIEYVWILGKYKLCNNNFITISEDSNKYIKANLPHRYAKRITLLPNAICVNKFKPSKQRETNKREIRMVSVGNLVQKKNHKFLIEVVKELVQLKRYQVNLDILGYGELENELRESVHRNKLEHCIHLRGSVNNVADYLNKANIYVHSALIEPFGLALIEAMATGLPVVSLDGGGNRDLVINNFNGYLLKSEDIKMFAEKIEKIVSNENLYEFMSLNSLEFSKKFNIIPYVDKLQKLYYKALLETNM